MDSTPAESLTWDPAPAEHFTGRVWFGAMHAPVHAEDLNVLGVTFEPRARTDWHTHPAGQVLSVVSGSGLVGTAAGETVRVGPGDTVYAPPGERHWHGAAPDSPMTHLSITYGGATEWAPEKVTDAEYGG